jgi:glycosyltransferase involved in cell wall biosynthesis
MLGFVLGDEKYQIMKRSRIFVFPSYLETFGQAICEAMACGLPIIAYHLPVYDEWYGDNIFRVNKGDKDDLCHSIIHLLENKKLRDKMGSKGQSIAKQYSWENVAKYQLEIINKRFVT